MVVALYALWMCSCLKYLLFQVVNFEDRKRTALIKVLLEHLIRKRNLLKRSSCFGFWIWSGLLDWLWLVWFWNWPVYKHRYFKFSVTLTTTTKVCDNKIYSLLQDAYIFRLFFVVCFCFVFNISDAFRRKLNTCPGV